MEINRFTSSFKSNFIVTSLWTFSKAALLCIQSFYRFTPPTICLSSVRQFVSWHIYEQDNPKTNELILLQIGTESTGKGMKWSTFWRSKWCHTTPKFEMEASFSTPSVEYRFFTARRLTDARYWYSISVCLSCLQAGSQSFDKGGMGRFPQMLDIFHGLKIEIHSGCL